MDVPGLSNNSSNRPPKSCTQYPKFNGTLAETWLALLHVFDRYHVFCPLKCIELYNSVYGSDAIGGSQRERKLLFSQKHKDFVISLPYENEVKEIVSVKKGGSCLESTA